MSDGKIKKKMKFLFFGAGVLGSFYAARMHEAGNDVCIVARGKRYKDLKKHGIVLEHFQTGERTTIDVKVVDHMPIDEYFDVCVVLVQNTQLESALDSLVVNNHIPTFLLMTNYVEKPQSFIETLGKERVMLGHVNAGGERDGHVVKYMTAQHLTLGELDGMKSVRLHRIATTFKEAGFPVDLCNNMDAWKRHHMALLLPLCNAMYACGTDNYQLARNKELLRKGIRGSREAMRMLKKNGFPIKPAKLRLLFFLPEFLLIRLFSKFLNTELMDIGGARHAKNAKEEMKKMSEEILSMANRFGIKTPVMQELHQIAYR